MKGYKVIAIAAAMLLGTTAIASAQGGSTDAKGNAVGSQGVGSAGGPEMKSGMAKKKSSKKSKMMKSDSMGK